MTFITRFAPSPTGPLHLGHAYSALLAHDKARAAKGRFCLRIEDIDQSRSRPVWEDQIYEDLAWLGITWDGPVMRQSERLKHYQGALDRLCQRGLIFACTCNRRDILSAASAPQEGGDPLVGPDGVVYPGTCRENSIAPGIRPDGAALRLNMNKALQQLGIATVVFLETGGGNGQTRSISTGAADLLVQVGDVVLARRDMGTSYHLSVVLDDAAQNISHVIRGQDLFEATAIHVVLQRLLGLSTPLYHHHRLIRDENGKRLAKRDDARAVAKYRQDGLHPADIRELVGLPPIP